MCDGNEVKDYLFQDEKKSTVVCEQLRVQHFYKLQARFCFGESGKGDLFTIEINVVKHAL